MLGAGSMPALRRSRGALGAAGLGKRLAAPARPGSARPLADAAPKTEAEDAAAAEGPSGARAEPSPEAKLAPELRGLAEKVAKEGKNGNLTVGKLKVKAGRVEIRVQLTALTDDVVAKLKKLGFKELGRAKSVKLLIGTIDVKQLEELAKLTEVRRVTASL
jgi:hypothetical protein